MKRWISADRPIVFFDLETTGISKATDRIIEIGVVHVDVKGTERTFQSYVNPGIPIPEGATRVNGITDAMVADAPTFKDISEELLALMDGADLGGFNVIRFDIELLAAEFLRHGHAFDMTGRRVFDALTIYHARERRDLSAAHEFYCNAPLEGAHSALADARASLNVLRGQFERYDDLPTNPDQLHALCNRSKLVMMDGEPALNFGKYPGIKLSVIAESDPSYLDWIVSKGDFPLDVKTPVADVLCELVHPDSLRRRPRKEAQAVSAP